MPAPRSSSCPASTSTTFLRLLQDYRATRAYLPPPIVLELAKHPLVDDYDLSRLRLIPGARRRWARPWPAPAASAWAAA